MGTSCSAFVESGADMGSQEVTLSLLVALSCLLTPSWGLGFDNQNCTFGPGICPVTKENVVDVFYFDVVDDYSCQEHCLDLADCHFFTMYGIKDTPLNHMKCFMFRSCDHLTHLTIFVRPQGKTSWMWTTLMQRTT